MKSLRLNAGLSAAVAALTMSACGGLSGYERVQVVYNVPAGFQPWDGEWVAQCPSGKKVLGGGYHRPQSYDDFEVWTSIPKNDSTWAVEVWEKGSGNPLHVWAICADAAS